VRFRSHALAEFWEHFQALPADIQVQANKQYSLFEANPNHPSLRLKEIGPYWSVRVSRGYRALARRRGNDYFWFWIGPHDEYERILKA
jgi:uncharacterized membrane protein